MLCIYYITNVLVGFFPFFFFHFSNKYIFSIYILIYAMLTQTQHKACLKLKQTGSQTPLLYSDVLMDMYANLLDEEMTNSIVPHCECYYFQMELSSVMALLQIHFDPCPFTSCINMNYNYCEGMTIMFMFWSHLTTALLSFAVVKFMLHRWAMEATDEQKKDNSIVYTL
ncbi:hypothetical protein ACJX0J_013934, partial [Zea mays]